MTHNLKPRDGLARLHFTYLLIMSGPSGKRVRTATNEDCLAIVDFDYLLKDACRIWNVTYARMRDSQA